MRPKSSEGIRSHLKALEQARNVLPQKAAEGVKSVRRISRSLQLFPPLKDPKIIQMLTDLQKAKEEDVESYLNVLLPRLIELTTQPTREKMVLLLVEDDPLTAHLLQKELRFSNREVHVAGTLKEAKAVMARREVSLILLDLALPDGDGRDFLIQVRQNPTTSRIPVVILSSKQQNEAKAECFALGADAYFEKPFDPATLSTAVAVKLQRLSEVTQQSSLDGVTGLPNRTAFCNAYSRASRLASRTKHPLSIAIIDLDRFKSVNDISGHQMGDLVLRKVSTIIAHSLRTSDLVARWGGEEFAVLFPDTNLNQARAALNKALQILRKYNFKTAEGRNFKMTFSAGVIQAEKGMTAEQAVAEADRYLYLAKAAGRNHVLSKENRVDDLRRNILLVEDDDFMASLMRRFLEKEGFRIFHARDGKTAQTLCSQAAFSLITLDVKLPDCDGFELLNRFRLTPTLRHVPIIMLTSTGNDQDVIRGFRMGADDYILKPFSPSQFMARVNRFLERQA